MEEIKIAEQEELKKIPLPPLPSRPQQSKYFNKKAIALRSNHYNLVVPKSMQIFVYDFKFYPEIDPRNRKQVRYYIKCLREQIEKQVGNFEYSGWMMFASKQIANVILQGEINKNEVKMEIKFTKQCENLKDIMSHSIQKSDSTKQIMNIIIKNCFKELGYKEIGLKKNFYDVTKKKILQDLQIEMWLGFYTSTEYFQSGPKLTVDCASKILRLDTALTYMNDLFASGRSKKEVKDKMEYESVMAYYGNYRTYQIHDIDFEKNPQSTFKYKEGEISFADYYQKIYKKTIKDMRQPLLLHNKRERTPDGKRIIVKIYLIPELLKLIRMTGLTDDMRRNRGCMKSITDGKPTFPDARVSEMEAFVKKLQGQLNKSFWNLQLQASEQIEGILMQQPEVMLGNQTKSKSVNGQFKLQGSVYQPANFNSKWVLLYLEQGQRDFDSAANFVETIQKCSGRYGVLVNEPEYIPVTTTNPKDYAAALINYLKKNKPVIVVSLIRRKNSVEIYKAIKQACYISSQNSNIIPSQNVLMETLQKNAMSVCSNILLQMNAKVNLALWLVQPVKNFPKNVMLIGADVHHKKGNKSIIGFCATLNSTFSSFYSRAKEQEKCKNYEYQEIMKSIGQFVFEGLLAYFTKNKQFPEHIIFFRDGVGDSQIDEVRQTEVKQVLSAFEQIKSKYDLKIYEPTFAEIIVKKKINDKFFVENYATGHSNQRGGRGTEKSSYTNVPSGTIVNSSVVSSNNFDYYMVAQNVNQGTATPTHYNVIYNSTPFTEDYFLELTFRQCFNYFNWQGAIKIPSVVKYADKLAFFYGTYLQRESDPELFEFLYYL